MHRLSTDLFGLYEMNETTGNVNHLIFIIILFLFSEENVLLFNEEKDN